MYRRALALVTLIALVCMTAPIAAQPAPPPSDPGDATLAAADAATLGPAQAITQKIAVWRIEALGLDAELVTRLDTLFRMELDRLAAQPLPTRRAAEQAAGKEYRDCSGAEKCLSAIGKKLGVDVIVTGNVAALGDNYILNIKAVEVGSGKLLRRITTEPLRGEPDELIEAIRVAAYRLLAPDQIHGGLTILTDLVGASVSLDGKELGKTPLPGVIGKLDLGEHSLRVAKQGYETFEEPVVVRFQKTSRVVVRLINAVDPTQPLAPRYKDVSATPWYARWYVWVGIGVVAASAGVGIYSARSVDVVDCTAGGPTC